MQTEKPIDVSGDDLNAKEIDTIVSDALLIIAQFTDVELICPCGSGLTMVQGDACLHCLEAMQTITERKTLLKTCCLTGQTKMEKNNLQFLNN